MEEKKKTNNSRKKKEVSTEVNTNVPNVEDLEKLVTEEVQEEVKRQKINPCFTTEEKLYITKLIANGYRPFDVVKKVRYKLKRKDEKIVLKYQNGRTTNKGSGELICRYLHLRIIIMP